MSDDLCDMKIKDLRNLAKKKGVNIKDSKGKLKKKCILIIDIIKKKYMSEDEIDFGDVIIEQPEPITKVTRFGDNTKMTIETENKPGKKVKGRSYTRRTLSEKEVKNFKPSKMSNKQFKQIETEKRQNEINAMSIEDENILSNDYPKYRIIKIKNKSNKKSARVAKLRNETDKSPFRIFQLRNVIDTKNFVLKNENPIAIFNASNGQIMEIFNKSALDEAFKTKFKTINEVEVESMEKEDFNQAIKKPNNSAAKKVLENIDLLKTITKYSSNEPPKIKIIEEKVSNNIDYFMDIISLIDAGAEDTFPKLTKKISTAIKDFNESSFVAMSLIQDRMKYIYGDKFDDQNLYYDAGDIDNSDFRRLSIEVQVDDDYNYSYKFTKNTATDIKDFKTYVMENYIEIMRDLGVNSNEAMKVFKKRLDKRRQEKDE